MWDSGVGFVEDDGMCEFLATGGGIEVDNILVGGRVTKEDALTTTSGEFQSATAWVACDDSCAK